MVTVIVQLNVPFWTTVPPTSLDMLTVRSAIWRLTVFESVFEVTPSAVAEATFVTDPAVTSPLVTV